MSVTGQTYRGVAPSKANVITLASVSAAAANTWYQAISSTSTSILVTGVTGNASSTGGYTIDIGTGAAGAEVVVATVYGGSANTSSATDYGCIRVPVRIPAGTRVAVRNSSKAMTIGLEYVAEGSVV